MKRIDFEHLPESENELLEVIKNAQTHLSELKKKRAELHQQGVRQSNHRMREVDALIHFFQEEIDQSRFRIAMKK